LRALRKRRPRPQWEEAAWVGWISNFSPAHVETMWLYETFRLELFAAWVHLYVLFYGKAVPYFAVARGFKLEAWFMLWSHASIEIWIVDELKALFSLLVSCHLQKFSFLLQLLFDFLFLQFTPIIKRVQESVDIFILETSQMHCFLNWPKK
jgi:hypothetical protein